MKVDDVSNKTNTDYFSVNAEADSDAADILLYGVIGQQDWWRENSENDITDIAIVRKMKELQSENDRINARINSPGGSVYHGNAIVTCIQGSTAEVHTYNDGLCASMAGIIWASAKKGQRHMAKNAVLMIHSPSSFAVGNAKQMRAAADMLDVFEKTAIAVMVEATGKSAKDVKAEFFDYTDHWMSYDDVLALGLVSESDDVYEVEDLVVTASEKVTMMELMTRFAQKGDERAQDFLDHIKQKSKQLVAYAQKAASFSNNKNSSDMNKKELKEALAKGELSADDIKAILAEQDTPAADPEPDPAPAATPQPKPEPSADPIAEAPGFQAAVDAAVAKVMEPIVAENTGLKAKVKVLGAKPGGNPGGVASAGDIDADDVDPDQAQLDKFNAEMNAIAAEGGTVKFVWK